MEHYVGDELFDRPSEFLISNVELMEFDPAARARLGEIVQVAGNKAVNDQDIPAFVYQSTREVRTDEPCAAGNEGSAGQGRMLLAETKRYFTKAHKAGNPSRQEIFFPSSTSRPVYRIGTS